MKQLKKILILAIAVVMLVLPCNVKADGTDTELTYRKDFDWGVVMHTPGGTTTYSAVNLEKQIHYAAQMGCKLIRTDAGSGPVSQLDKLVQLANEYGMKIMLIVYIPNRTFDSNYDTDIITQWYYNFASRYDGKHNKGKIDYIQIDNELDLPLLAAAHPNSSVPSGTQISHYKEEHLKNLTVQLKAAVAGINQANSDVKSIINMSWTHYGMLQYFYDNGVDWDIVGNDWYSNMFHLESNTDAYWVGDTIYNKFHKPIIICETNMFNKTDETFEDNASNYDDLIKAMGDYYKKDYVIGATIYELSDEIEKKNTSYYNQEANFGLIYTNDDGSVGELKPVYHRIKQVMGGKDIPMLDWEDVRKKYKDDSENNGGIDESIEESEPNESQHQNNDKNTYTVIKPDPIIVKPDPINKDVTNVETIIRKIPVSSGKIFTLPIIISIIVGGIAVVATTLIWLRIKKYKKSEGE